MMGSSLRFPSLSVQLGLKAGIGISLMMNDTSCGPLQNCPRLGTRPGELVANHVDPSPEYCSCSTAPRVDWLRVPTQSPPIQCERR